MLCEHDEALTSTGWSVPPAARSRLHVVHGWPNRHLLVTAVAAALVLFAAVYPPYLSPIGPRQSLGESPLISLVNATVGAAYLVVGISAWHDRPHNRVGPLMVALGFGWLSFQLFWLPGTVAWMSHYLTNALAPPLLVWLALVYPSGRFQHRLEWIVVVLAWFVVGQPDGDYRWARLLDLLGLPGLIRPHGALHDLSDLKQVATR